MDDKTRQIHFMYLLEKIGEPLYISPRGQGKSLVLYNIPADVLEEYEANAMIDLRNRISGEKDIKIVTVSKTSTPYDLTPVQVVPRGSHFSYLSPVHQKAADTLTKILMSQPNITEYFNACALCRDAVNPHLWIHSFISTILRREDMRGFIIPHFWEIIPDLFIESQFIKEAHKQAALFPANDRAVVEIPATFTGFDTDPEHKMAYWREDMGLNSFHWHFHLANPFTAPKNSIDRKGELFFIIHHEMLARYNTERMTNGLNRVIPLYLESNSVIEEAYFSKLTLQTSGIQWGARQINTAVRDINRVKDPSVPGPIYISDQRIYGDRIKEAIDAGFALSADGKKVSLLNDKGISVVASLLESSFDSINLKYYGELHNNGHRILATSHDPDFRYRETRGVMSSTATACRDPVFWRWHIYVELIFRRHKETLMPYAPNYLSFDGVTISSIEVHTPSLEPDNLLTFWMKSDVDLSRGLDFQRTDLNNLGPVWTRITHINHRDFEYKIKVKNDKNGNVKGTIRIFMAPKLDEQKEALPFSEQRNLFFQLDKFVTSLHPGENIIERKSLDSALTIPWGQTFRNLERDVANPSGIQAFCGCGWPQHLLLPKGRHEGLPFDLFVMITDYEIDRVIDPNAKGGPPETGCSDAVVLCGSLNRKYPDSRPMGYPFDRLPPTSGENANPGSIADFVKPYSNMCTTEVKIFHRDVTVTREGGAHANARILQTQY